MRRAVWVGGWIDSRGYLCGIVRLRKLGLAVGRTLQFARRTDSVEIRSVSDRKGKRREETRGERESMRHSTPFCTCMK